MRNRRGETMMVSTEQPCQRYSGVTWHAGKWLVKLRHRGKDLTIGHYEDPEEAAVAADFTRYMLMGLNPANWYHNVARPNFPPRHPGDVVRGTVLRRLMSAQVVPLGVLLRHWAEYRAVLEQNAASEALGVGQ
jgi:hypothetical protein